VGQVSDVGARRTSSGAIVALATVCMNVATYGFTIVAARVVGPSAYGEFAACLSLLIVIQVAALGIQATAARRIANDGAHVAAVEHAVLSLSVRLSVALGLVLLALSPAVKVLLNLDSLTMAAVIAVAAIPMTLAGGQAGVLQGERRWAPLAVFYLAAGLPRLVIGTAIILWQPNATAALVGVAVGLVFPVLVGLWTLRHRRRPSAPVAEHSARSMLVESAHNSQTLFAFFALSSVDIVIARHVLSEHDAGLYAAGLIMTKVMLFLPQFVVVIAFPDMAAAESRRRAVVRSLLLVAVLGVVAVLAAKVLSGVAMIFVGGADFAEVEDRLWLFALLGTVLAMLQLQVYAVLARQARRSVGLVWAALAALVALGTSADSLAELVVAVAGVDSILLVLLTVASLRLVEQPTPPAGRVLS